MYVLNVVWITRMNRLDVGAAAGVYGVESYTRGMFSKHGLFSPGVLGFQTVHLQVQMEDDMTMWDFLFYLLLFVVVVHAALIFGMWMIVRALEHNDIGVDKP